jgi:U6 snRNA-associated Sm-like protein LSm1
VLLRDGRTLVGYLRSYDQFANLVLNDTYEFLESDRALLGVLLIRGENVVMVCETEQEVIETISVDELNKRRETIMNQKREDRGRVDRELAKLGFCVDHVEGDLY